VPSRLNDAKGVETQVLRGHAAPPGGVAFSPDARRLVTAGRADQMVKLWDVKTGQEILTLGRAPQGADSVAFSADGLTIVAAGRQDVRVWDAAPVQK
jgi:WD40 repeat protein